MAGNQYVVDAAGNVRTVSDPDEQRRLAGEGREFVGETAAREDYQDELAKAEIEKNLGTSGQVGMGVASGLTLGMGPQALASALGPNAQRQLRVMQGSGAYMLGEAGGMFLPAIFSGGESLAAGGAVGSAFRMAPAALLGEVGGAAERLAMRVLPEATGTLGKAGNGIIQMAARGASEGALMGLTSHIGQNILYNRPLTAEALAAAEDGALFGGLMGGGIGAVGHAVGAGVKGLGGVVGKGTVGAGDRAAATVARELGADAADVAKMTQGPGGTRTLREAVKELGELNTAAGENIGNTIRKGPAEVNRVAKELVSENWATQKDIAKMLDLEAPTMAPSSARMTARLNAELLRPAVGTWNQPEVLAAYRDAQGRLNKTLNSGGSVWDKLLETREQLRKSLSHEQGMSLEVRNKILNIVDDELGGAMRDAAKTMGKEGLSEQFQAAATAQRVAEHLEEMTAAKAAKKAIEHKPVFTPQDIAIAVGGSSFGHPLFAAGMLAAKGATRMLESRVAPALAQMAYNVSVGSKAAATTASVKGRIGAAVKGFFNVTKTGAMYGNTKDHERQVRTMEDYDKRIDRAHELLSPMHQARVEAYARQLEASGQVELANETLLMYQRASQYLQNNLPPSTKTKGAGGLGATPKYKAPDLKGYKLLRQLSAVENPIGIVDRMASGDVSRDEVMAMKYVYPELHAEVVSQVTQSIYEMKSEGKFLPADKIATLGVVLDAAVDTTLTPEFIGSVQASFAPPQQPNPTAPVDKSVMASGADYQTATQKVMT